MATIPLRAVQTEAAEPTELPHSHEAEQALLGALLIDNRLVEDVQMKLRAEHFYSPLHGRIFDKIIKLIDRGMVATPVTLRPMFDADPEMPDKSYLAELTQNSASLVATTSLAQQIYDLALLRELVRVGREMVISATDKSEDIDPQAKVQEAEMALYKVAEQGEVSGSVKDFSQSATLAVQMAERALKSGGHLSGITTGLEALNAKLGGLHRSDLVILAGRPAMGKAQPLDAQVLTVDGWKRMGDLRPGERLASVDGATSLVSGIFPQGERDVYRVTFSDGRSAECCDEHLWRVHYRAWEAPRVMSTAELREKLTRKRYQKRLWIDLPSGHFGHAEALPVDPWLLGALIGDGCFTEGSVRFSTASAEILAAAEARLPEEMVAVAAGGYDYRFVRSGGAHRRGVQGVLPNDLKEALLSLELWGKPAEEKFIPPLYLTAGRAARLDLLRGLLDTDGWVERWGSLRFCSSSERLARDVAALARSLGATCSIRPKATSYTYKGERRTGRTAYVCNIQASEIVDFVTQPEKRARLANGRRRTRLTLASIERTRTAPVQCIAVTHPSRTYITDNYVVTHNTALATNMAFAAAQRLMKDKDFGTAPTESAGAGVAFFSLEMSSDQLATRILAEQSGVSSEALRMGRITQQEFRELARAAADLENLPLYIDDTPGLTIAAMRTRARRLKRQKGIGFIVVDYLQLLQGSSKSSGDNRVQEISEITRGLKTLAKELNVPVLALSQLSRAVEQREDKRPQLADLRESGTIEQDADIVLFVYREEYYHAAKKPEDGSEKFQAWLEKAHRVEGRAEVIVAKQRHGATGIVPVMFHKMTTKFSDLTDEAHVPDHY